MTLSLSLTFSTRWKSDEQRALSPSEGITFIYHVLTLMLSHGVHAPRVTPPRQSNPPTPSSCGGPPGFSLHAWSRAAASRQSRAAAPSPLGPSACCCAP